MSLGARTSRTQSSGSVLLIFPAFCSVSVGVPPRPSHWLVRALKYVPGFSENVPAGR